MKLTANFNSEEMRCPCCGVEDMDDDFMDMLQMARDIAGIPFHINSGFRCVDHNSDVGGVLGSMHTRGKAADIRARNNAERGDVVNAVIRAGFNRVGIYESFIHVDTKYPTGQKMTWLGR